MKRITSAFSHINVELKKSVGKPDWFPNKRNEEIISSQPFKVNTYNELVESVSLLGYHNRDYHLFYRGQDYDYKIKGSTTILPSIYRKKPEEKNLQLKKRFEKLDLMQKELLNNLNSRKTKLSGTHLLNKYPEIRYSILQHYEVCGTPLLDLTHSLHVACSFAFDRNNNDTGIVYVIGMPAISESISYYISQELLNIRLLSICPPQAKRPFFQEGYTAGPFPIYRLDEPGRIPQFDFARRLIGKFEIPKKNSFWGEGGFRQIDPDRLYQPDDIVSSICEEINHCQ
jgi:hypothetical protein